jgi:hypothetical protein
MALRTVTWGDALLVHTVKHHPRGLQQAVENIRGTVGREIGVRNSFAKLYMTDDPEELTPKDQWRAWLLLTAINEKPADWGISDDVLPYIHRDRIGTLQRFLTGMEKPSQKAEPGDYMSDFSAPKNRANTGIRPKGRKGQKATPARTRGR